MHILEILRFNVKRMAYSAEIMCGTCNARHIREAANFWCTSCDEGLCFTCFNNHKANRKRKHHQPMPLSEYTSLESFMKTIQQECNKHDKTFDFYCINHNTPCCVMCITESHKKCLGLKPIDVMSHKVKSSTKLLDIERGLKELENTLQVMKSQRKANLDKLKEQQNSILKEIMSTRLKLNTILDQLEIEISKELSETYYKEENEIQHLLAEITEKEENIKMLGSILHRMTNCQVFLATRQLSARLTEEEKWITNTCDNAKDTTLKLQVEQKLGSILFDVKSFGEIKVIRNPYAIKLEDGKPEQAQLNVPTNAAKLLDKTAIQLVTYIAFKRKVHIRDCTLLPDGRMVFADRYSDNVLVYKQDGTFSKRIYVSSFPYGLTTIDSKTVALSCWSDTKVHILDVDTGGVIMKIKVSNGCSGLSYYNGKLYVLVFDTGIMEFSVEGKLIQTMSVDVPTNRCYLSCYQDGFCYTTYHVNGKRCLTCCDLSGNVTWESDIGNGGVVVDNRGNIFVTNLDNKNLYMLSFDGQHKKWLLSKKDGLENPESVSYNKDNNTLLVVTDKKRNAAVFRLISK